MSQTTETPQPTNAELVAQVVGAVTAVQDAEAVLVEGAKNLADHIADPNAHGRDVAACIAQAVADHDGNTGAHAGTFVKSDDVRLSDARTPKPHKATHGTAGSDPITPSDIGAAPASHTSVAATASVLGHVKLGNVAGTACEGNDPRLSGARTPTAHAMSHEPGGNDALTRFSGLLTEKVQNLGVISGAVTINLASGHYVVATVGGAVTINVSGAEPGVCTAVMLELDNAGSAAVTWGMTPTWAGGVAPSLTASGKDYVGLCSRGEGWAGVLVSSDAK